MEKAQTKQTEIHERSSTKQAKLNKTANKQEVHKTNINNNINQIKEPKRQNQQQTT